MKAEERLVWFGSARLVWLGDLRDETRHGDRWPGSFEGCEMEDRLWMRVA